MKKVTLLLTIYKASKNQLEYWSNFYKANRDIAFHILVDDDSDVRGFFPFEDIYVNETNKGQFQTVINHVKKGNVKTEYFKVVDPDDYISIKRINNFKFPDNESIILMEPYSDNLKNDLNQDDVESYFSDSRPTQFWMSFSNSYTIIPTKYVENDIYVDTQRVDTSQDQVLGIIAIANGANYIKVNDGFYFYRKNYGSTNIVNINQTFIDAKIALDFAESILQKSKTNINFKQSILNYYKNMFEKYCENIDRTTPEYLKISNNFSILIKSPFFK